MIGSGLRLQKICKSFGTTTVLSGLSLELEPGELLVLLGPSGCGKSTLLRIIAGLETADSGRIFVGDKRIDELHPRDRDVAMVFQNYSLYPHMTVEKNIGFPLKVAGVNKDELCKRVLATAEMLGLADRLKDRPGQLSGGQRQRVALGRAIIRDPALFLLDEPLSNLDADLRERMRSEIVRIQKSLKKTTIHVTHDQTEALTMADRIALMHEGNLIQVGTPEELYKNPCSVFAAQFIGQPRINMIEGVIENGVVAPLGMRANVGRLSDRSAVMIGIRPEAIRIEPDGDQGGTVTGCEYLGDQYIVELDCDRFSLTVSRIKEGIEIGAEVRFSVGSEGVLFFEVDGGGRI